MTKSQINITDESNRNERVKYQITFSEKHKLNMFRKAWNIYLCICVCWDL